MLIIAIAAIILLSVVSVTFAYFIVNPTVSGQNQIISTESGTLELTFSDADSGISAVLNFGETTEAKQFTIQNTGTKPVSVNILWDGLTNTYLEGSLTYTLEQTTNTSVISNLVQNANVPRSPAAPTSAILAENVTIPAETTYSYKLYVTLQDLQYTNQTPDINAAFNSGFKIEERTGPSLITFTVNASQYQAEENMTWHDWISSPYNTDMFSEVYSESQLMEGISAGAAGASSAPTPGMESCTSFVQDNNMTFVNPTSTIIANYIYQIAEVCGGSGGCDPALDPAACV